MDFLKEAVLVRELMKLEAVLRCNRLLRYQWSTSYLSNFDIAEEPDLALAEALSPLCNRFPAPKRFFHSNLFGRHTGIAFWVAIQHPIRFNG